MQGILPAPVISSGSTPSPIRKATATPAAPATEVKPKPSLPSLKRTPSFSIKDAMAGKTPTPSPSSTGATSTSNAAGNTSQADHVEEEEESFDTHLEEVELTPRNLEIAWTRYADHIKPSRPRIYHTLTSTKPTLMDDNLITFDVMNTLQKEEMMNIYVELLNFLRRSLSTPMLELEFNVAEIDSTNSRPYTVEEKFKHMLQKNPALLTLKQSLGLDFE